MLPKGPGAIGKPLARSVTARDRAPAKGTGDDASSGVFSYVPTHTLSLLCMIGAAMKYIARLSARARPLAMSRLV